MTQADRDRLVARIVAGCVPIRLSHSISWYQVRLPSREDRMLAEEVYADALSEAETFDLMDEKDLEDWLWEEGFWDEEREKALRGIPKDIENLKTGLYENRFDPEIVWHGRQALIRAKDKYAELFAERHSHDAQLAVGYARLAKLKFVLAAGLFHKDEPVYPHGDYSEDDGLLDEAMSAWHAARLEEHDYRELARTHPWRPIWQSRDASSSLFGSPACDMTEEQLQLTAVSQLYDNVRQHPECPHESVLNDDDMLDGWLILENRKRGQEDDKNDIEGQIRNEKIKNSQEVFFVCKDQDTARKVKGLNSPGAQAKIAARNRVIEEKGEVLLQHLPDMKQRLQIQKNQNATS